MKPIPAIVEPADSDIVRAARAVDHAITVLAVAEANVRERRLELGRALIAARGLFPATGRNAGGWSRFVADRKLNMDVALDAMKYAGWVDEHQPDRKPGDELPTREQAGLDKGSAAAGALSRTANVHGGSGETARGAFCTPRKYALAVGSWDLDPFSNPRSHIVAAVRCMLEDGGDGFGDGTPGSYRTGGDVTRVQLEAVAVATTRVWIQPPYERGFIARAVAHYGHTRFCALLRFAPDTEWFALLWPLVRVIAIPRERLPFETPDGVRLEDTDEGEDRGAPFPHVFFYADERDVTDEIRRLCIVLRVEHETPNT